MGTIKRIFQKIRNWFTSPGKTFGTGWAPTRRWTPEPKLRAKSSRPKTTVHQGNESRRIRNKIQRRRSRRKIAAASRKANRS